MCAGLCFDRVALEERGETINCRGLKRILLSTTNRLQRYIIFFITANALHVSGGFSARHQELKNCTHSIRYVPGCNYIIQ